MFWSVTNSTLFFPEETGFDQADIYILNALLVWLDYAQPFASSSVGDESRLFFYWWASQRRSLKPLEIHWRHWNRRHSLAKCYVQLQDGKDILHNRRSHKYLLLIWSVPIKNQQCRLYNHFRSTSSLYNYTVCICFPMGVRMETLGLFLDKL